MDMDEAIAAIHRTKTDLRNLREAINRQDPEIARVIDAAYVFAGESDLSNRSSSTLMVLHHELHDDIGAALERLRRMGNIVARARDAAQEAERKRAHQARRLKV